MFDRVVVSVDENPNFIDFVPVVSQAWKKFFPEAKLAIAFVTSRNLDDPVVQAVAQHGDMFLFPRISEIPSANQAKVARHVLAGMFPDEVCMIEDIDTIPLQRKFFEERTSHHVPGKLLAVGREVYGTEHPDKFPISTMTAEGRVFAGILNPMGLQYLPLFQSFYNLEEKAGINYYPAFFSDESLFRYLLRKWPGEVVHIERGVDIRRDWIDRSWWGIDQQRLVAGEYVTCNFLRNLRQNFIEMKPVLDYIYEKDVSLTDVIL